MSDKENQTAWHSLEVFSELLGFRQGLESFESKGVIKWTNTASSLGTGGVHGLRYKVENDENESPKISLQHWVHLPGNTEQESTNDDTVSPDFISLRTQSRYNDDGELEVRPVQARVGGKIYTDPAELDTFMRFLHRTAKAIWRNLSYNTSPLNEFNQQAAGVTRKRDEIPNLYQISQESGFDKPIRLKGMLKNGEFNFSQAKKTADPPVFSRALLRAMLGIEGSVLEKGDVQPFTRSYSMSNPDGGYEGISYSYQPDVNQGFRLSCEIWNTNSKGEKTSTPIYNIAFTLQGEDIDKLELTDLEMLPDPHFKKPDLTDHVGVVRAIRAMKYIHLAILQGRMPEISKEIYQHDLKSFLRAPYPPQTGPEDPRVSFELSTDPDKIGSNSVKLIRDFKDNKGEWVKQAIRLDAGASFTEKDDFYDSLTPDYSKDLVHPRSPHLKPDGDLLAFFITHEHEDHLRGLARQVKFGFDLPPIILNEHTKRSFNRMMSEEGVPIERRDKVLSKSLVINPAKDGDSRNPDAVKTHEFDNVVIAQGTEKIWSEENQSYKYFPRLEIFDKRYPESRFPVRIGPAGHSAYAMMCEVDGVLYTGDYKLDQTLPEDQRSDLDWLASCRDTTKIHFQESTNALKESLDVPTAEEVARNRKQVLLDNAGKRVFADMIGSNAIDVVNFCETLAEANEELHPSEQYKYVVFAGTALQRKYGDLNKTHKLKDYLKTKYGITALMHSEKKGSTVQKLLDGEQPGNYAIIGTGTQDEPVSITHRVSRGLHPSINLGQDDLVLRLQAVIPTGDNFNIRAKQNQRFREELGCTVYDANEEAQKGNHIYHSGHTSKADLLLKHDLTKDAETGEGPLQILFHGSPDQKQGLKSFLEENGQRAVIPDPQGVYEVLKDKRDIELIAQIPEQWAGYKEIRADPEQFFNKHRQQQTNQRNRDQWFGDAAQAIQRIESHHEKMNEPGYKPTSRGANLHDDFDDVSQSKFPPIGIYGLDIEGYVENYSKIGSFIAMDSETTGRDVGTDVPISSSFVAGDAEGNILGHKTVRHALPPYRIMGPGAALVTGIEDLEALHRKKKKDNRYPSRQFSYELIDTYRKWPKQVSVDPDEKPNAAFITYRGVYFDDPITMRMNGTQLAANDMKPMSTYGNMTIDLYNVYTALIALKPDQVGTSKDKNGNYERTLGVACSKNGIKYEGAHDDLNDARMTLDLFYKFREIDPDLIDQMFLNADFKASGKGTMIDHILGQNQHPKDQAPVFGYVDRHDRKCRPRIGGLVTIDTKVSQATHAIVVDLARSDIHQLEAMSDEKLLDLLNDPGGPFSVIKLNQSPPLFPPEFIYRDAKVRRKAVGDVPKATIMQRANALKELRKFDDGPALSFSQRIQELYPQSTLYRRRPPESKNQKATRPPVPANDNNNVPFQVPSKRIFSLFELINNFKGTKNKYHREAGSIIRSLTPHMYEFMTPRQKEDVLVVDHHVELRSSDPVRYWNTILDKIRDLDENAHTTTGHPDPYIRDLRFLVEWMVHDICPQALPKDDGVRVNALKSAWLQAQVNDAYREIEEIEKDPEQFERLVGKGRKAKQRWKAFTENYLSYLEKRAGVKGYQVTPAKEALVRSQWRDDHDQAEEKARRERKLRGGAPGASMG